MTNKNKTISVIIACYRDELAIPVMYERLTKVLSKSIYSYEIIFVNDASPDNSRVKIIELSKQDNRVKGITHTRNFGSQSAFLSGMDFASGDGIVLMDGDLQDPPELIEEFIEKWENGYEVVYGVRTSRDAPIYMQFFYKLFLMARQRQRWSVVTPLVVLIPQGIFLVSCNNLLHRLI